MNMKRISLKLLLLVSVLMTFAQCKPAQEELNVVSFNIRMGVAKDGENSWEYRKAASAEMVKTLAPDIMGVQEAFDFQTEYIKEQCPDYDGVGVGRDDGKTSGEIMMIFYNTKKVELEKWGTFWLSETPDVPSFGWDAACRRTATWALLKMRKSGKEFYYVNTHLDHIGRVAEKNGLKLIVDRIDSINPQGFPMILTGDFNVLPQDAVLNDLNKIMSSARATADTTDSTPSFNAFGKPLKQAAIGDQFVDLATTDGLTIDYIYYSGFSKCPKFRTVTESFAGVPYISDHYPVTATLEF